MVSACLRTAVSEQRRLISWDPIGGQAGTLIRQPLLLLSTCRPAINAPNSLRSTGLPDLARESHMNIYKQPFRAPTISYVTRQPRLRQLVKPRGCLEPSRQSADTHGPYYTRLGVVKTETRRKAKIAHR